MNLFVKEVKCMRLNVEIIVKIELKGISKSQSKHIKFEESKKCLYGEEYQRECDVYILHSNNHEMYLQQTKKSTLFFFDDKTMLYK